MRFISAEFIFDGKKFLPSSTTLCTSDEGEILDILPSRNAETKILKGLITPGFVNTHCHLELSYLKNQIPQHQGLVNFLLQINAFRKKNISPKNIEIAIQNAENEMIKNGIVAVGDIANTDATFHFKSKNKLHYHTFIETISLRNVDNVKRLENVHLLFEKFKIIGNNSTSITLHAPYSTNLELTQSVNNDNHTIFSIHNQESEAENILFEDGTGEFLKLFHSLFKDEFYFTTKNTTSLKTILPYITKPTKIILVHNTYTRTTDIAFAKTHPSEIYWCICPNANLYIENKLPDLTQFIDEKCTLVLGTDSLASNTALSIVSEINTIQTHFPEIELSEILQWATYNGACALNLQNQIGTFAIGKKPSIILFEDYIGNNRLPATCKRLI